MTLWRTYSNPYFRGEFCRWNFWYIRRNLVYSLLKERVRSVDIHRKKSLQLRSRHLIKPNKLLQTCEICWLIIVNYLSIMQGMSNINILFIFRIWLLKCRSISSKWYNTKNPRSSSHYFKKNEQTYI